MDRVRQLRLFYRKRQVNRLFAIQSQGQNLSPLFLLQAAFFGTFPNSVVKIRGHDYLPSELPEQMRRKAFNSHIIVFTHWPAALYCSCLFKLRTLCLCTKDLPVKYFHTSCSQKVTKYFLSSLISSSVCMNSLATPYPFLEVHCVLPHLTVQLSKPFVVP